MVKIATKMKRLTAIHLPLSGADPKAALTNIPRHFPRRPEPPRSGGLACPPSSADRQFLERGSTEA
jgi:hypothetical protein